MARTVSVYITSYNQRAYLIEAVDSVLDQSLQPHQIIIVDDCSTDGSQDIIAGYASRYPDLILPIYHAQNLGVSQTRIDALQAVTGDYVTYVDGDDRFLPTKLQKEVELLQRTPSAHIVYSNNYYMTEGGVHTGTWITGEVPPQGNVFVHTYARDFPRRNLFRMELVRYDLWKQVGFHDPRLTLYEDFDMRIRLTKVARVGYVDEPLSEIRCHNVGLSKATAADHLTSLEYIYRKNEPLLQELDPMERRPAQNKARGFMAGICRRGARQILGTQDYSRASRLEALDYFCRAVKYDPRHPDFRLLLMLGLPRRAADLARSMLCAAHQRRELPAD